MSLFGGGTDYPEYYEHHPGAILGTTIDKFIYITALRLERFLGYRYRLSYRINEEVDDVDAIRHPVFRAVLRHYAFEPGWNFGVMSSLPARSGLGSSSAFTVGLLKLIAHLRDESLSRRELADRATFVEQRLLAEKVGIQDQLHAAFGGLNLYRFDRGSLTITPVRVRSPVYAALDRSLYLVHTGIYRQASDIAASQVARTAERKLDDALHHLARLADEAASLLEEDDPDRVLADLGRMLDDSWRTKRSLSGSVSSPDIDALYDTLLANGALGGKLCGAGGGGFLLAIVPGHALERLSSALGHRSLIPIRMDTTGSTVMVP